MARFEDFVREWYITDWQIDGEGPIPRGGFAPGSLAIVAPFALFSNAPKVADLAWKNTSGQNCVLRELSFREENGTLHDPNILVYFAGLPRPIMAAVTLSIGKGGVLQGHLQHSGPPQDGNTGTFAADADPPRPRRRPGRGAGRDLEGAAAMQYHDRPHPREK